MAFFGMPSKNPIAPASLPAMENNDFTNLNIVGVLIIGTLSLLTLMLPRRLAAVPILTGICYVSLGQVLNVAGLHFTSMRIIIFAGWMRILFRGEFRGFKTNPIDQSVLVFAIVSLAAYVLNYQTQASFVYQLGITYNVLGAYFVYRCLVRSVEEILMIVKYMAIAIIPLAISMTAEKLTGRNFFSYFGSVPHFTMIREGRLRCQGPFSHPILAGTFGVTLTPLFMGAWRKKDRNGTWYLLGALSSTVITVLCASSGPLLAYLIMLIGMTCWKIRDHMRKVRWILAITIIGLHLAMKAPVWHLIGRMSSVTGGTGYHRVMLISAAVKYFKEWALVGTTYTAHWMPYILPSNPDHVDITNQYIAVGVDGGLISLILFLTMITRGFRYAGLLRKKFQDSCPWKSFFAWAMGVSVLTYVISFVSIAMFGFTVLYWYMILAFIGISIFAKDESLPACRSQEEALSG